jgi:cell division protease FtsH
MAGNGKKKQKTFKFKLNFSWKNVLLYGVIVFLAFFVILGFGQGFETAKTVPLSQILSDVKKGNVSQVEVVDTKITATEKNGTKIQAFKEPSSNIYQLFNDAKVSPDKTKIQIRDDSGVNGWINIATTLIPVILMIAFFYFLFRQARGAQESIFSFGQSKAKLFNKDQPKTTFADVAGVDEAKQELTEIVDFLKNPQKYKAVGARTPKGVLMIGPSGTGKTLLARATAGEAGVAFLSMAGSEFMEMLVGVGASRVRDLFTTAKKAQPAIIFIDEIDAIGRQRGVGLMGGHDEREQTLNQILVEMDGLTW